jgi:hypothetical protein
MILRRGSSMNRARFIVVAILVAVFTTIAYAQQSGGPAGTLSWDSGYPQGDLDGKILGKGTFIAQPGWTVPGSGLLWAYQTADATADSFNVYEGAFLVYSSNNQGT